MEIITRRGFKKFWTAPVAFTAAVISVLGICWVCDITNGFGASKRVPSAISVNSVTVSLENMTGAYIGGIKFRDKDVIKAAVELNKEIVDRHFKPENYSYNTTSERYRDYIYDADDSMIEFEYTTLTGSSTMRNYRINSGMADKLVKAMLLSDEYAKYQASKMGNIVSQSIRDTDAGNKYNINIKDKLSLERAASTSTVTARQLDKIRNAYIKDMKDMTEEELLNGDVYCFIDDIWVLESFENTIEALDVDVPEITASSFTNVYVQFDTNPKIYTNVQAYLEGENGTSEYYYYGNDDDDEYYLSLADKITKTHPDYPRYNDHSNSTGIGRKNVLELVKNCTPIIIGEMPLAIVTVDNLKFYLRNTPENAQLLKDADISESHSSSREDKVVPDEYGWDTEVLSYMD